MSELNQRDFALTPEDNARLANLCGPFDEHPRQIELRLGVEVNHRGHLFRVIGEEVAVRAGDVTQVDLPRSTRSGLRQSIEVLRSVDGISFTFSTSRDVVRHPLVAKIVRAYEAFEQKEDDAK